jgi:hypothetical protein
MARRGFIRTSVLAAAGAALGATSCTSPSPSSSDVGKACPTPCAPSAWQKQGIVLEPSESWEDTSIQNFTCPAEPLKGGAWRIWYSVSGARGRFGLAYAEGIPGEPMKKVLAQCSPGEPADAPFAIGNLPETWMPVQGVHIHLRNGQHRLYFWAHGPQILRYLAAESDDGRRYRVLDPLRPVLYHPSDRATYGVTSPDGLKIVHKASSSRPADEPLAPSRLMSNDATNIYQLPDGTFEIYSVGLLHVPKGDPAYMAHDNAPGLLRVIDRYTSGDGLHIETRQRVIQPDAGDPVDQQFYYLSMTQTPKGRVGMLGHYRCDAQTMDLEWCFSHDGIQWQRPLRRAWLPRGNPPEPDCYGIYGNSSLVHHNRRWHLFYTGVNEAHNHRKSYGKPRQLVMYATTDSIWA